MAFDATSGEPLPTRIKVANWGRNVMRGAKVEFLVNEQTARDLPTTQAALGLDGVPGDYEHQSVVGHPNYKPDPRDYWAKRGRLEVVAGEGLFYVPGEYTPSGAKHAASYQDVSGVFRLDPKTKAVIAVRSVALCEHGQVEGAEFIQASIAAAMAAPDDSHEQILTYARDLLDLGDDSTADDVVTGMEALVRQKNTVSKPSTKPNTTMDPDIKAAFDAQAELNKQLTANLTTISTSLKQLTETHAASQHNAAVEAEFLAASRAGKKVPDTLKKKDDAGRYLTSADVVKEVCAALPVTVETQFTTPGTVVSAGAVQANEQRDSLIIASLGIDPKNWKSGVPVQAGLEPKGAAAQRIAAAA
jgi:hypothetical protein